MYTRYIVEAVAVVFVVVVVVVVRYGDGTLVRGICTIV